MSFERRLESRQWRDRRFMLLYGTAQLGSDRLPPPDPVEADGVLRALLALDALSDLAGESAILERAGVAFFEV